MVGLFAICMCCLIVAVSKFRGGKSVHKHQEQSSDSFTARSQPTIQLSTHHTAGGKRTATTQHAEPPSSDDEELWAQNVEPELPARKTRGQSAGQSGGGLPHQITNGWEAEQEEYVDDESHGSDHEVLDEGGVRLQVGHTASPRGTREFNTEGGGSTSEDEDDGDQMYRKGKETVRGKRKETVKGDDECMNDEAEIGDPVVTQGQDEEDGFAVGVVLNAV